MTSIVVLAIDFAALRNASAFWAGMVLSATLFLLGVAIIGGVYGRGAQRAWWFGFALFGWGYLVLAFAPWFDLNVEPGLATAQLLEAIHARVSPTDTLQAASRIQALKDVRESLTQQMLLTTGGPGSAPSPQLRRTQGELKLINTEVAAIEYEQARAATRNQWRSILPGAANQMEFQQIGHCSFALLGGVAGGMIARRMREGGRRAERAEA
jgi:hypothetical protein